MTVLPPLPVTFLRSSKLATLSLELPTGNLSPNHPFVGRPCIACYAPLTDHDTITLIPLGPGADDGERAKCQAGRGYNAVAIAVHAACAGMP
jgi:hypothetical protein